LYDEGCAETTAFMKAAGAVIAGVPYGNRTRVAAVKENDLQELNLRHG